MTTERPPSASIGWTIAFIVLFSTACVALVLASIPPAFEVVTGMTYDPTPAVFVCAVFILLAGMVFGLKIQPRRRQETP